MDTLYLATSGSTGIRLRTVDVTMSAKALEARHRCGPSAGRVMAEALVGAALLSSELTKDEDTVTLQMLVTGPVKGLLVEATGGGGLRGFTYVKTLTDFDNDLAENSLAALGDDGKAQVIYSAPGKVLSQSAVTAAPPHVRTIIARHFNYSVQRPTAVEIVVHVDGAGVMGARGAMSDCLPDGDHQQFFRIVQRFNESAVASSLVAHADAEELASLLEISDFAEDEKRRMSFQCRCSRQRTDEVLRTLPNDELKSMLASGSQEKIVCHMCGREFLVNEAELEQMLRDRQEPDGPDS